MKSRLSINIFANFIGRAWPSLLGIIFVPVYLRFMGIEAYGLVGFYATLQGIFGLLDFGIGSTITREMARLTDIEGAAKKQRDVVRTLEVLYWLAALGGGAIIILLAPILATHWVHVENIPHESMVQILRLMGVSIALQFPFALYQGGLMGLQRQVLVNLVLAIFGTFRAGGAVIVVWLISPTIHAFMSWQVLSNLVGVIIFMSILWNVLPRHALRPMFKIDLVKELKGYAITVAIGAVIGVALVQSDKLILSYVLPMEIFAYYVLASTIASAIWMIIIPMNNAIFPRIVRTYQQNRPHEFVNLFHSYSQYLSLLLLPLSAVLIFNSADILRLWTHNEIVVENSKLLVILLVIGTTINGLSSVPAVSSMAVGWPQLITKINIIQAGVAIPVIAILSYEFQGEGAASAWIGLNLIYLLIMCPLFINKYINGEIYRWFLEDITKPCLISFVAEFFLRELLIPLFFKEMGVLTIILSWMITSFCVGISLGHTRRIFLRIFISIKKKA